MCLLNQHLFVKCPRGIRRLAPAVALVTLVTAHSSFATQASRDSSQPHISVEMLSKTPTANLDGSVTVGIAFTPDERWHIYWLNPGDTGLAPTIDWKLPAGYTAGELSWPFPHSIPIAHLTNYGYEGTVLLSTTINANKGTDISKPLMVKADLSWLVCEESCVPGESSLSLEIPSAVKLENQTAGTTKITSSQTTSDAVNSNALFEKWETSTPKNTKSIGSKVKINTKQKTIDISLYAQSLLFKKAKSVEVFIKDLDIVRYGKPLSIDWDNNWLKWEQTLSEYYATQPTAIEMVVVVDHNKSYEFVLDI